MKIDGLHIKPHLAVDLEENSFIILGVCQQMLRELGVAGTEVYRFVQEATSGDREHLIAVVESTFDII